MEAVTFTAEKFCLSAKVSTVGDFRHIDGVKAGVEAVGCGNFVSIQKWQ